MMSFAQKRLILPLVAGIVGTFLLSTVYLGIVSLAESPQHALDLFWQDRWFVVPIIVGFGVQIAFYTILKLRLFIPNHSVAPSGKLVGAGGLTSTLSMVACCAHHVTDALPLLGLTAAATFLTRYKTVFMVVGLGTTLFGIFVMLIILFRERRKAIRQLASTQEAI